MKMRGSSGCAGARPWARLALLTLALLALDVTGWVNARRDREAMAEKRALIADRDQIRAEAEEFLNRRKTAPRATSRSF